MTEENTPTQLDRIEANVNALLEGATQIEKRWAPLLMEIEGFIKQAKAELPALILKAQSMPFIGGMFKAD